MGLNIHFAFKNTAGGHGDGGDVLEATVKFDSEEELRQKLQLLGIPISELPLDEPEPIAGTSYSGEEFSKFKHKIPDFKWLKQPGWQTLCGHRVWVWVGKGRITLEISDGHKVTSENQKAAREIEKHFRGQS